MLDHPREVGCNVDIGLEDRAGSAPIPDTATASLVLDLDSYGLVRRHAWQSDGLCTGKERNRNVAVFGRLAAQFNV